MISARSLIPAALCAAVLLAARAGGAAEKSGAEVLKLEDFAGTWTGKTKFQDMEVRLLIDAAGNVVGGAMGSHPFANPCFPPSSGWIRLKRTSTSVEAAKAVAPGIEALTFMNTVYKPEGWAELARAAGATPEELAKCANAVEDSRRRALANRDWCMGEWKKGNRPLEQCVANMRAIRKEFLEKLAECLGGKRAALVGEFAALAEEFEKEAGPLARTLQDKKAAAKPREEAAARYRELQKRYGEALGRKLAPAPAGQAAPPADAGGGCGAGGEAPGGSCCPDGAAR